LAIRRPPASSRLHRAAQRRLDLLLEATPAERSLLAQVLADLPHALIGDRILEETTVDSLSLAGRSPEAPIGFEQ
jgi:hypothetical protein